MARRDCRWGENGRRNEKMRAIDRRLKGEKKLFCEDESSKKTGKTGAGSPRKKNRTLHKKARKTKKRRTRAINQSGGYREARKRA